MIYKFILIILLFASTACSTNKEANLKVNKIEKMRTELGVYYENVELINTGEIPALFVILIGKAYYKGVEVETVEKGFGDLYPNEKKSYPMTYSNLGRSEPDSVVYRITYSQSENSPVR